jgi:hypothetical protein
MKFLWLDDKIETITQFNLKDNLGTFILNRFEIEGRIDELPDKLEEADEGIEYTSRHESWLIDNCDTSLKELKKTSLNELVNKYVVKHNFYDKLGEMPDDFTLGDINNRDKAAKFIGSADEDIDILRGIKEISKTTVKSLLREMSKNPKKDAGTDHVFGASFKVKTDTDKNIIKLILQYQTEEPNLDLLGTENFTYKPLSRPKTVVNGSNIEVIKLDEEFVESLKTADKEADIGGRFLEEYQELRSKESDVSKADININELLLEEFLEGEELVDLLPEQIFDPYNLYNLQMTIEFRFDKLGEISQLYEIDERKTLPETTIDDKTGEEREIEGEENPNYGEPILDENGEKIPLYEEDDLGNFIEVKVITKLKHLGKFVVKSRSSRDSPYNRARDVYVKSLRNKLDTIEEAIDDIPKASD